MPRSVTIQGIEGCFHDAAAREYFNLHHPGTDLQTVPCDSFEEMFQTLDSNPAMTGIMAIENTIAGPLLQNHELLRQSSLTIVGEHKMRISHVLAAIPGSSLNDICEVNSHPMAIMQCRRWLDQHPRLKISESFDTAGSARNIAKNHLSDHAAICGKYAADLYGLNTLAENIETNKRNFTRFLIVTDPLSASELRPEEHLIDKASVVFTLPHTKGALSKVLAILSFYDINLSKIQSTPIIGREWEYRFYVDLTFDSHSRYIQAIDAVRPLISDFKSLGEYRQCQNETI
ncbi:MAG: prephenate dehydratase [Bacteroides sp.]|nr:prephenate dehydratase [Bacteroides sp.]MCM1413470.1 prephenate dehydratase [Bacteroides sp.]MCM1471319.1 prephenate dehydratase [Bacteroides sp.]